MSNANYTGESYSLEKPLEKEDIAVSKEAIEDLKPNEVEQASLEKEITNTPEPLVVGNEEVAILKHDIYRKGDDDTTALVSIGMSVKNVTDEAIGSALLEAEFLDIEGKVLNKIKQKVTNIGPKIIRKIHINYEGPNSDKVRSYCIRVIKVARAPKPEVAGNEKVSILKHKFYAGLTRQLKEVEEIGVDFAIRNVSGSTIATVIFEAKFYDIEGNVLDTTKHKEVELPANTSRAIIIRPSIVNEHEKIKSYNVSIVRTVIVDFERVQLRRHTATTTETGEEEITGLAKNISEVKTDAAVVATFLNSKDENIGTRVIIVRDIEPNTVKQFHLKFKPQDGDVVRSYVLHTSDLVE